MIRRGLPQSSWESRSAVEANPCESPRVRSPQAARLRRASRCRVDALSRDGRLARVHSASPRAPTRHAGTDETTPLAQLAVKVIQGLASAGARTARQPQQDAGNRSRGHLARSGTGARDCRSFESPTRKTFAAGCPAMGRRRPRTRAVSARDILVRREWTNVPTRPELFERDASSGSAQGNVRGKGLQNVRLADVGLKEFPQPESSDGRRRPIDSPRGDS